MEQKFKQDKGVAGLTILLSVVVMLFMIGLLVMIFSLMGGQLKEATWSTLTPIVVPNETASVNLTEAGITLTGGSTYSARSPVCTVTAVNNATTQDVWGAGNYTQANCVITFSGATLEYNNTAINVSYSYVYQADTDASDTINGTTVAIGSVVDWFDIFIVITAMVVLILLTVIIITAIRGSGMIAGAGSTSGANSVGTA